MRDFVEYVLKGRWNDVRPPTEQELKGTMVIAVPLVEASSKVRTGFAVNDAAGWQRLWSTPPAADPRQEASVRPASLR